MFVKIWAIACLFVSSMIYAGEGNLICHGEGAPRQNMKPGDSRTIELDFLKGAFSEVWNYRGPYPVEYHVSGSIQNVTKVGDVITFSLGEDAAELDLNTLQLKTGHRAPSRLQCRL